LGPLSLAVFLAVTASQGMSWLITRLGGYHVSSSGVVESLVQPALARRMIGNALALASYLPDLYRCGLPEEVTLESMSLMIGCLLGPVLVLYALVRGCPIPLHGRRDVSMRASCFVSDALWASSVLAIAAFVASSLSTERASMRYMIPFVLSASVLTGRVLADQGGNARRQVAVVVLLGLTYGATVVADVRKPPLGDPAGILADWLEARGLRHGYGPFWSASIVTASGRGRVAVRPVRVRAISPQSHSIEPLMWMVDESWYAEGPATFVVVEPGPRAGYQFGMDESICTKSFGRATGRHAVGPYTVLVWDHDLRPQLNRPSGL